MSNRITQKQIEALAEYEAGEAAPAAFQHTHEPWRVSELRIPHGAANVLSRGYVVAHCDGPGGIGQADARRIVACVNACAGMSTADIEALGLGELAECARNWTADDEGGEA